MSASFPKQERLSGRSAIARVFEQGNSIFKHPLKLYFIENPTSEATRFLVSVPKRAFKRAVDRNLLKRRIREVYRLNKAEIEGKKYDIACIYVGKEIVPYSIIETKLLELLLRLK